MIKGHTLGLFYAFIEGLIFCIAYPTRFIHHFDIYGYFGLFSLLVAKLVETLLLVDQSFLKSLVTTVAAYAIFLHSLLHLCRSVSFALLIDLSPSIPYTNKHLINLK